MNFDVLWLPVAGEELERIWDRTGDRDGILRAVWAIEAALRDDPEDVGESRPGDLRVTFAGPLGVLFTVFPADRKVEISSVWYFRSR